MTINNIALITWSNGWLWQSLVQEFLDNGYFVLAGVKDLSSIQSMEHQNSHMKYIALDITKSSDIENCRKEVEKLGKLKVLVNNAGISGWGNFWKRDISIEKNIFEVNLWGTINMVKTFWNSLEENSGSIINIWSISWTVPTPFISSYSAAKSALEKMMLALFLEKRKNRVRILHINLWPLDKWMCGNTIRKEEESYNEKIRQHMIKIQKIHGYDVAKVSHYILKFIAGKTQYKIKTLWIWSNIIVIFARYIPQPYYQKIIGRIYRSL